nr:hypothetical protein CFP56_70073 [Quercus suber]
MESVVYVESKPPYLEDIAGKPYPTNYTPPIFPKYNGIIGNAREHIKWYVDALTTHSYDHELRLREFSKSLKGRAFTWYTSLALGFRDLSLQCYVLVEEERLMDVCIMGMLYEYWSYLENLQISSFTRLVEAARRTSMSIRKPSIGSTSQAVAKGKKRDRGGIPPPFIVSIEELYSILEAWVKDGVVTLPESGKKADPRMHRLEVVMTLFIGREDPMEEEAENMASSSSALPSLADEEIIARI